MLIGIHGVSCVLLLHIHQLDTTMSFKFACEIHHCQKVEIYSFSIFFTKS
jgi:hypothetical protein